MHNTTAADGNCLTESVNSVRVREYTMIAPLVRSILGRNPARRRFRANMLTTLYDATLLLSTKMLGRRGCCANWGAYEAFRGFRKSYRRERLDL
jgi:hypothetical protein